MKEPIENEIEKAMHSIDGIARAEAPAFLHTRVMAGIQAKPKGITGLLASPVSLVTLLVLLVLNVTVITGYLHQPQHAGQSPSGIQQLANELSGDNAPGYNHKNMDE